MQSPVAAHRGAEEAARRAETEDTGEDGHVIPREQRYGAAGRPQRTADPRTAEAAGGVIALGAFA
jgi:hypothetical protein